MYPWNWLQSFEPRIETMQVHLYSADTEMKCSINFTESSCGAYFRIDGYFEYPKLKELPKGS